MLKLFLETWYSLPLGWRRLLTALPAGASLTLFLITWEWPALVVGLVISFILLILPGPSDAEKKGYHF